MPSLPSVLLSLLALAPPALPQSFTWLLSEATSGGSANGSSAVPDISQDARVIAFQSGASDLVPGDTNGTFDVFVYDRQTGQNSRVSLSSSGTEANGSSGRMSISADGRFVAFESVASNLVTGDTNLAYDIFVHDRSTGVTTRESLTSLGAEAAGPGGSLAPSISAEGRFVAFSSSSTTLVPADTNGTADIFIRDRLLGTTTRASVTAAGVQVTGDSTVPSLSGDGRYVAFRSAAAGLVAGDTNGATDIFVKDLVSGAVERVSVDTAGVQADNFSNSPCISSDGRFVAFSSAAANLIPADLNGVLDIFLRDRVHGTTERVSEAAGGLDANDVSFVSDVSSDGRFVTFDSFATNLVPGDSNGAKDVFLYDRLVEAVSLVSTTNGGAPTDEWSQQPSVSADGRFVAFASRATNIAGPDSNGAFDVFLHDRGPATAFTAYCFGDGTDGACPCGNPGASGHGCNNSAGTGGAVIMGSGVASLASDTVTLSSSGQTPSSSSLLIQSVVSVSAQPFTGGLLCAGGAIRRMYLTNAAAGATTFPPPGQPTVSARSAATGDAIAPGSTRTYQVYYRDAQLGFCPGGANLTHALAISWGF